MMTESTLEADEEQIVTQGLTQLLGTATSGKLIDRLAEFAGHFIVALLIIIVGWQIIRFVRNFLKKALSKGNLSTSTSKLLINLVDAAMYVLLAFLAAEEIGIPSATIIALIGSVGIAIGLSLQGSLSNVAGGLLILLMRPFSIGDYIVGDGVEGTVQNIGMVYTTILTADNRKITIPNSTISNSTIINVTSEEKRRVEISTLINYDSDIKKAKEVMENVFRQCDQIIQDDPVSVFVSAIEDSGIRIAGRGYVLTEDYWQALWEIQEEIITAYDEGGLTMAYKQIDVNVYDSSKPLK